MLKLAWKQFKTNWKISIGIFIVLLVSCALIASTSFLMMAAVGYANANYNANTDMKDIVINVPAIALVFAVSIFLSIIVIYSTLNLSVKLKIDQYAELRILGFSFRKIRSMIYAEAVIILLIPLLISMFIAKPLAGLYAQLIVDNAVTKPNPVFDINQYSSLGYLYIPFTLILIFIILGIAVAPIKKISMTGSNNLFNKSKKSIIWEWIFGVLFIAAGVAIAVGPQKPLIIPTVLFPEIFFVIAYILIGKYIVNGVLFVIKEIFNQCSYFANAISDTRKNSNQNSLLITMVASMIIFIMFSTDTVGFQAEGMGQTGGAIFTTMSLLLTIVVVAFSVAVAFNSLMIYFVQKEKDYDNLRILGYTKGRVIAQTIYEALILGITGVILGIIPGIAFNLGFTASNSEMKLQAIKNVGSFIGMVIGIPVGFSLIGVTITSIQMAAKKIR